MYKKCKYTEKLDLVLNQLGGRGAFLNVENENGINPMTIGWGSVGVIWSKPIFTILVRESRYTYELIEKAKYFTITVPLDNQFDNELIFCGTKSGRDIDKTLKLKLNIEDTPNKEGKWISGGDIQYVCKIVNKQKMNFDDLSVNIKNKFYPKNDKHHYYFGEIIGVYEKE
jgi:flavin reductase (DIM6/NTAB) family NADH-FMN oxidoreductase RutF